MRLMKHRAHRRVVCGVSILSPRQRNRCFFISIQIMYIQRLLDNYSSIHVESTTDDATTFASYWGVYARFWYETAPKMLEEHDNARTDDWPPTQACWRFVRDTAKVSCAARRRVGDCRIVMRHKRTATLYCHLK